MVTIVTNLGRSGTHDWLIQRVSAVVIAVYVLGLVGYLVLNPDLDYSAWVACMTSVPMRIVNTLMVFAVAAHAWIGVWTVSTDYLTSLQLGRYATAVRLVAQCAMALFTLACLLWGLLIVWRGI